ncbi:DUF6904 family protein [Ornithinibacillus contaminans]|uniref:DUF6904 family protein n=1 Tax=Ornithinibacillus contaminans TaxID=694055 RepID=UPI00064D9CDE|nr:hypothetical protein [Ornithinibacillus contaminans]
MLKITPTPNFAGVEVTGDFHDFDLLYESLHRIVGGEDEYPAYESSRMRILGFCYDLRHAMMGNREIVYVDHGISDETMKWKGMVGAKKNLYLSFNTYYPEILYIVMALNEFIRLYEQNKNNHKQWDLTINTVNMLRAAVVQSLSETLKPHTFKMMLGNMSNRFMSFSNYFTQYLDQLNIRFLKWDKEKRLKNISIMAKRIAEQGTDYQKARRDILEVAHEDNVDPSEIRYYEEYPDYEEIEW